MQDQVKLKLLSIAEIMGNSEVGIITLVDEEEKHIMAMVCDVQMKQELHLRLSRNKVCNTMLPEILVNVLKTQVGYNFEIVINDIVDGEYRAMLVNTDTGQPLSMRASDAVLLHLISKAPLYVSTTLFRRQAMPYIPGSPSMALPFNVLTDKMLQEAMDYAVEHENYEMASKFRDELKKRGKLLRPEV